MKSWEWRDERIRAKLLRLFGLQYYPVIRLPDMDEKYAMNSYCLTCYKPLIGLGRIGNKHLICWILKEK